MKITKAIVWPKHWTTPRGNESFTAPVDKGVLIDVRPWQDSSTAILVVRCRSGSYYGTIRTAPQHFEAVVEFLSINKKRMLREIKEAETTFTANGLVRSTT